MLWHSLIFFLKKNRKVMKKFSEMDIALMELQKMGNDEFRMGFQYPGATKEEALTKAIEKIQEYIEEHKGDEPEDAPYGFRVNFEFFKKGEPKNTF
jgi:hypothetical protein